MPTFQLRFLRPDDSYKRVEQLEFASDAEARSYVLEHHPQKATELWDGDRRVSRRVSPRHEARLRGDYPWECIYPVLSRYEIDKLERTGPLSYSDFQRIGRMGMAVFQQLGKRLRQHEVWFRAVSHPLPPPTVERKARFSIHPFERRDDEWSGSSHCTIWSHVRDGTEIVEDLVADAAAGLIEAYETEGIIWPGREPEHSQVVRDGLYLASSASAWWRFPTPGPP